MNMNMEFETLIPLINTKAKVGPADYASPILPDGIAGSRAPVKAETGEFH